MLVALWRPSYPASPSLNMAQEQDLHHVTSATHLNSKRLITSSLSTLSCTIDTYSNPTFTFNSPRKIPMRQSMVQCLRCTTPSGSVSLSHPSWALSSLCLRTSFCTGFTLISSNSAFLSHVARAMVTRPWSSHRSIWRPFFAWWCTCLNWDTPLIGSQTWWSPSCQARSPPLLVRPRDRSVWLHCNLNPIFKIVHWMYPKISRSLLPKMLTRYTRHDLFALFHGFWSLRLWPDYGVRCCELDWSFLPLFLAWGIWYSIPSSFRVWRSGMLYAHIRCLSSTMNIHLDHPLETYDPF